MFQGFRLFILICIFVLGVLLGGGIVNGCRSKPPTIKAGKETLTISVVIHDTVNTIKTVSQIKAFKKIDTIYIPQNATTTLLKRDSAVCYSFDEKEKDGAFIQATLCSDSFAIKKPFDLKGNIFYISAPESTKTIRLTNTVVQTKMQPFLSDWRFWTGCIVFLVAGAYAGHSLK